MIDFEQTALGIEFGSTRIKAVLIDRDHKPVASGSYDWENQLVDGVWTYAMETIHKGLQACYADLAEDMQKRYGQELTEVGAIGISGMMHGYLPFGKDGNLLTAFRTWRNTITGQAAEELTEQFGFDIPRRWSVAHLYQAVLNREEHLPRLGYLTTLAGYIHWKLTGRKVVGIGEAAGMFPIDSEQMDFDRSMIGKFDALIAEKGCNWRFRDVSPQVLAAGQEAGSLTEEGRGSWTPPGS